MTTTVLVDGNSIGYAAHHGTKLSAGTLQTQAVFGFIRGLRELKQTYKDAAILVLWDGKAQFRYDLLPEYKSNRTDDPKKLKDKQAYVDQRPYIHRALQSLGISQMTAYDREADDLAGLMVQRLTANPASKVILITGDRDWLQLLRPNVTWRDPRDDDRVITMQTFTEKTGYRTPYAFLQGKALQGDVSDCIGGVGGIGEKGAPIFLATHGSVANFWSMCASGAYVPSKKAEINLYSGEGRALFGRNFRLMQLLKPMPIDKSKLVVDKGSFDADAFKELCGELSFLSILKTIDNFLSVFKPN